MHRGGEKEPVLCAAAEPLAVAVKGSSLMSALLGCCVSALCCKCKLLLLTFAVSLLCEDAPEFADARLTAWLGAFPPPPVQEARIFDCWESLMRYAFAVYTDIRVVDSIPDRFLSPHRRSHRQLA